MEKYVIIVAGGKGVRMNSAIPKQFLPLLEKPVLYYSINAFRQAFSDIHIVLVLPEDQLSYAQMVLSAFPERIDVTIVTGGETRYHSVQNGLKVVEKEAVIFVHDGVRPLVSAELIKRCYEQAVDKGSAVPALRIAESIRMVNDTDDSSEAIDRDLLCSIQTPQTFRSDIILPAFKQPYQRAFTDEATVVEAHGMNVYLVEGERRNIKVTTPEDMLIAEAFLKHEAENV
jgi:2-C-methyl-D-erythritol 4-phosphate cytidylyltransferase